MLWNKNLSDAIFCLVDRIDVLCVFEIQVDLFSGVRIQHIYFVGCEVNSKQVRSRKQHLFHHVLASMRDRREKAKK